MEGVETVKGNQFSTCHLKWIGIGAVLLGMCVLGLAGCAQSTRPAEPYVPVGMTQREVVRYEGRATVDYRQARFEVDERAGEVYGLGYTWNGQRGRGLKALEATMYLPRGHSYPDKPSVVIVRAGGGGGQAEAEWGRYLAARGYVAMVAQTRTGADQPPDPSVAAVMDGKLAVRWLRRESRNFGVDSSVIAMMGVGAGSALAWDVAMTDPEAYRHEPRDTFFHRAPPPYNEMHGEYVRTAWVRACVLAGGGRGRLGRQGPLSPEVLEAGGSAQGAGGAVCEFLAQRLMDKPAKMVEIRMRTPEHGRVWCEPGGGFYPPGTRVTLRADPDPGYRFLGFEGDKQFYGLSSQGTTEDRDWELTPSFESELEVVDTKLEVTIVGSGSARLTPPGGTYPMGTVVEVLRMPAPGHRHRTFDQVGKHDVTMDVPMDRTTEMEVQFLPISSPGTFRLEVTTRGEGRVRLDPPGGSYAEGTSVRMIPEPGAGRRFVYWAGDTTERVAPGVVVMNSDKRIECGFQ